MTDKGYLLKYIGVDIKKNSYGTFELSQLHLVEKIINHVRLTVFITLNSIEAPAVKPLMHRD